MVVKHINPPENSTIRNYSGFRNPTRQWSDAFKQIPTLSNPIYVSDKRSSFTLLFLLLQPFYLPLTFRCPKKLAFTFSQSIWSPVIVNEVLKFDIVNMINSMIFYEAGPELCKAHLILCAENSLGFENENTLFYVNFGARLDLYIFNTLYSFSCLSHRRSHKKWSAKHHVFCMNENGRKFFWGWGGLGHWQYSIEG